tara:strand:+ start:1672 stop:2913 length:1242 start_codon:yes stop_codon:yes gene_type:complete
MVGRTTNFPTDGRWSLRKVRDEVANDSWVGPPAAATSISSELTAYNAATISYTAAAGLNYKVYWATSSGVDTSDNVATGNQTTTNLTGLTADTTIYYVVATSNSLGTALSAEQTLTTFPSGTTFAQAGNTYNFTTFSDTVASFIVVPANKTISMYALGATGGGGGGWNYTGGSGGGQGSVAGSKTFSSATTLKIWVGGAGKYDERWEFDASYLWGTFSAAGSGGGATAILNNSDSDAELIVAGGGGGGSSGWNNTTGVAGSGGVISTTGQTGLEGGDGGTDSYNSGVTAATISAAGFNNGSYGDGNGKKGGLGYYPAPTSDTAGTAENSGYGDGGEISRKGYGCGGGGGGGYKGGSGGEYPQGGGGGASYKASGVTSISNVLNRTTQESNGGATSGGAGSDGRNGQVRIVVAS